MKDRRGCFLRVINLANLSPHHNTQYSHIQDPWRTIVKEVFQWRLIYNKSGWNVVIRWNLRDQMFSTMPEVNSEKFMLLGKTKKTFPIGSPVSDATIAYCHRSGVKIYAHMLVPPFPLSLLLWLCHVSVEIDFGFADFINSWSTG